ncbi:serine hydrolase-like protein [Odontomachus brunneus]|uniref:serine hydrolase-like protein n=1 Tax=Odontomachus brunneus TaxID=486640 RepID=UPI0013F24FEF|nr:serine hydrolase-like protein [Odontomachus brunneus]XP_032666641.1 serine hydrolase-like protein [Odontomachus brunneus]XP_032666642.1 serine hydrolase-like protein [Odontomachus brunneus]XP_032666643.1 serine hydrolase-like protein [Odontomachus brunneus]
MAKMEQHSTELKLNVPWGHVVAKAYGSSTGKFVLVVHGLLDNLGSFTRLIKYLPMEHYYVCIDLPGHGRSSHFPSWMTLDFFSFIHAIYYILEALQWKTCIYLGHSLGAQLGIAFSVIHPHRIEKLIALDGLIPIFAQTEETFMESFKELFTLPIAANSNSKITLYTKEEILYALKNMRFSVLSSDAAKAMFDRAVTEVNGKYKYNRDMRLKRKIHTLLDLKGLIYILRALSVPLYLFIGSQGIQLYFREMSKVVESINPKSLSQLSYIEGNHDFHNNYPERVAPFICQILCENSSKL